RPFNRDEVLAEAAEACADEFGDLVGIPQLNCPRSEPPITLIDLIAFTAPPSGPPHSASTHPFTSSSPASSGTIFTTANWRTRY
ncbi:hypothetical protein JCM11251_002583, partial [Rhodosporidiobolus azoricus]